MLALAQGLKNMSISVTAYKLSKDKNCYLSSIFSLPVGWMHMTGIQRDHICWMNYCACGIIECPVWCDILLNMGS